MPDITMCKSPTCTVRESCWRFTATPTPYWQAYFAEDIAEPERPCDYFWQDLDQPEVERKKDGEDAPS